VSSLPPHTPPRSLQEEVAAAAATVAALSGERDSHRAAAEEAVQRANVSVTCATVAHTGQIKYVFSQFGVRSSV
jgi:hypothetical protein